MNRFRLGIFTLTLFCVLFVTQNQANAATFTRTLKIGMSGADVRSLQMLLNRDPDTRIRSNGVGSIGQESTYFGALTQDAVIRFQEKYSSNILTPNGLTRGTGVVGVFTLSFLNGLTDPNAYPVNPVVTATTTSVISPAIPTTATNPNLVNLDKFLSKVEEIGTKKGLSSQTITSIKDQIIKDAATTTDLRANFITKVKTISQNQEDSGSMFAGAVSGFANFVEKFLTPKKVIAASGVPFGGALYYAYFCTCSYNWLLYVEPLPPSYAALLTYEPFSQAYLGYNIPYTAELLGMYSTGGTCAIYYGYGCLTLPSEGYILPMVGSSGI